MEKEIEKLKEKMDAIIQSKNVSKEELIQISYELDILIDEMLNDRIELSAVSK